MVVVLSLASIGPHQAVSHGHQFFADHRPSHRFHVRIYKQVVGTTEVSRDGHLAGEGLGFKTSGGGIGEMEMIRTGELFVGFCHVEGVRRRRDARHSREIESGCAEWFRSQKIIDAIAVTTGRVTIHGTAIEQVALDVGRDGGDPRGSGVGGKREAVVVVIRIVFIVIFITVIVTVILIIITVVAIIIAIIAVSYYPSL